VNTLLFEASEFDSDTGRVVLSGRRRRHAEEILKARVGDSLKVGLIEGNLGTGRILNLDREILELQVSLEVPPPPKLPLWLVLALPRPPVFRRLLSTVSSMGVDRLLIAGTARTEKSFWQSHVVEAGEIRERLLLGIEQSCDTRLPEVSQHRYFESLIEEILPVWTEGRRALVAHPTGETECPHSVSEPITLFVGPEGGFVDYEVDRLRDIGFEAVGLGQRVLRVEPVIPMLIGRLF
jgi:16S rRNA (uracil1498-N3)-methyltransferase